MNLHIKSTLETSVEQEFSDALLEMGTSIEELQLICSDMPEDISEEDIKALFKAVGTSFKTFIAKFKNVSKIAKKRYKTEYSSWIKKEKKIIVAVQQKDYDVLKDVEIDYPTGMNVTYPFALELLAGIFGKFDKAANLTLISTTIDQILNSMSNNSAAHEQTLSVALKTLLSASKPVSDLHVKLLKGFSVDAPSMQKKKFGDMYKSMDELKSSHATLGQCDEYAKKTPAIGEAVNNIENSLELCVSIIDEKLKEGESNYVPTKQFITEFANFIATLDTIYVVYGDCVIRTLAITHNMTFVYRTLYKV